MLVGESIIYIRQWPIRKRYGLVEIMVQSVIVIEEFLTFDWLFLYVKL